MLTQHLSTAGAAQTTPLSDVIRGPWGKPARAARYTSRGSVSIACDAEHAIERRRCTVVAGMLFVIGVGVALGIAVGIVLLFLFVMYMRRYFHQSLHNNSLLNT